MLALIALTLPVAPVCAQEPTKEQKLKAAFIYNFTKFIDWPDSDPAHADTELVIGTFCEDALNLELERVVRERNVNGRTVRIRRLESVEAASTAHLIYVCSNHTDRFGRLSDAVHAQPVVTVGDVESAIRLGATIAFVIVDDRIRFDINARSVQNAGVKVSAQLLKLARTVHGR